MDNIQGIFIIDLGEKKLRCKVTMEAIERFEDETGISISEMFIKVTNARAQHKHIALWVQLCAASNNDTRYTSREIGQMMLEAGFIKHSVQIVQMLEYALTGGRPAKGNDPLDGAVGE